MVYRNYLCSQFPCLRGLTSKGVFLASNPDKTSQISDVELINGLVSGSQNSFETFYRRYEKLIYHCIRSRVKTGDADEIFQEFFIKLQSNHYRSLDLWNRNSSFVNYLSTIVRNFTIDRLRAKSNRELSVGHSEELDTLAGEDVSLRADDKIERRSLRRSGIKAWLELRSDRDRRLICHKYHRDTPSEVIGQRENLTGGAIRKALFDAQKRFMLHLKVVAPEYFPIEA